MSANALQQQSTASGPGSQPTGGYRELTPHEFNTHRDMGVVVLKATDAAPEFAGFHQVFSLGCSSEIDSVLQQWPRERALGLVCQDGTCSGRLAIRLSRQGYTVYHLAGGLHEWRQCWLEQ